MHFVNHVTILSSIELVDIDVALRSTRKQMSSVGESNLSASLDGDRLE